MPWGCASPIFILVHERGALPRSVGSGGGRVTKFYPQSSLGKISQIVIDREPPQDDCCNAEASRLPANLPAAGEIENRTRGGLAVSLDLQVEPAHQRTPPGLLGVDIGRVVLRRARQRYRAFGGKPRAHVVRRKRLPARRIQPADDVARRPGRRQ